MERLEPTSMWCWGILWLLHSVGYGVSNWILKLPWVCILISKRHPTLARTDLHVCCGQMSFQKTAYVNKYSKQQQTSLWPKFKLNPENLRPRQINNTMESIHKMCFKESFRLIQSPFSHLIKTIWKFKVCRQSALGFFFEIPTFYW